MVLVFKGVIQGTDRGGCGFSLLPFLIQAGIRVMFYGGKTLREVSTVEGRMDYGHGSTVHN